MPTLMRYIVLCLPVTIPSTSLRNAQFKSLTIADPLTYNGILVLITWIIGMIVVISVILRVKRKSIKSLRSRKLVSYG